MTRHLITLAKLIANAIPCALVLPTLLLALLMLVNPEMETGAAGYLGGWLNLLLHYGLPALVVLPLMVSAVRFFAAHPLRLEWIHLKSMAWFLSGGTGLALAVFALNLAFAGGSLPATAARRLSVATGIVGFCWVSGTVMAAIAQARSGRTSLGLRAGALVLLIASGPLSILPAIERGGGGAHPPASIPDLAGRGGPVMLLGIEGASFSRILPLVSEGRLPNLAQLLKDGAYGSLESLRPCRSASAWGSLSTGKLPGGHGLRDDRLYRMAGLHGELRLSPMGLMFRGWLRPPWLHSRAAEGSDLLTRPLWTILDRLQVEAAFLEWPFAAETAGEPIDPSVEAAAVEGWRRRLMGGAGAGPRRLAEERLLEGLRRDRRLLEAVRRMQGSFPPRLTAAWLPGLGAASRDFLHYGRPEGFGDLDEEEVELYRHVVPRYYELLDEIIGEIRSLLPDDGYLLIVSAYGIETQPGIGRFLREMAGLRAAPSGHADSPAGVLILSGPGVAAGRRVEGLRIADVVPLALYLLGQPVGKDMDGRLPRRLFQRHSLEARPITFIPSYG